MASLAGRVRRLFLVIAFSGLGGGARYLMGGWVAQLAPGFPWGTIAVNGLGSFLIVVFMQLGLHDAIGPDTRLALTTGLMGGFTTYSTFNYETMAFFEQGAVLLGAANVAATVAICLVTGALGLWAGRALVGT